MKKIDIQKAVKLRILELARAKNLSINKVAANCFINTSTITSILNGHSKRSEISTLTKICYGLGVTIKEFFDSPLFDNINYLDEDL